MASLPSIPYESPVTDGQFLSSDYYQYLFALQGRAESASSLLSTPVELTNQSATIATTAIPLPALTAGLYVMRYYARITVADGVSSSLTVTLGWTESAQALTFSGAAMTGDTVTTVQSNTIMVQVDANTSLRYSTVYASNTPAKMRYRLSVTVESLVT